MSDIHYSRQFSARTVVNAQASHVITEGCIFHTVFCQRLGITQMPDAYRMDLPSGLTLILSYCPILPLESGVLKLQEYVQNSPTHEL